MPKIAELTIEIKNEADRAVTSLRDLKKALDSLKDTSGAQNLSQKISQISKTIAPVSAQCRSTASAFSTMGNSSSVSMEKAAQAAQKLVNAVAKTTTVKPFTSTASSARDVGNATEEASAKASNGGKKIAASFSPMKKLAPLFRSTKNAIKSLGSAFASMGKSVKGLNPPILSLLKQFGRMFRLKAMRMIIQQVMAGFKEGTDNLYEYSRALNSTDSANFKNVMDQYNSALLKLKNSVGAAVAPILQQLLPSIQTVIATLVDALNLLNQFISLLQGKNTYTRATDYMAEYKAATDSATGSVKELKRTILGFDEINKLDGDSPSGSGSSGTPGADASRMFEEVPIDTKVEGWLKELKPYIDDIKDAWDRVKQAVTELVNSQGFKFIVGTALKMALSGISTILDTIGTFIGNIKTTLENSQIQGKIAGVEGAWNDVLASVEGLVHSAAWQSVVDAVAFIGLDTLEGILSSISGLIDGIKKGIEDADANGKIDAFKEAWDRATDAISALFNSEGFQYLISTAFEGFLSLFTGVLNVISSVARVIKDVLNEAARNGSLDMIQDAFGKIGDGISRIADSEVFKGLLNNGISHAIDQIGWILDAVGEALQFIASILEGDIPGAIRNLVQFFISIGTVIGASVIAPIQGMVNGLIDWFNNSPFLKKIFGMSGVDVSGVKVTWLEDFNKEMRESKELVNEVFDALEEKSGTSGKKSGKTYKEALEKNAKGTTIPIDTDIDKKGYGDFKDEVSGTVMNAPVNANITKAKQAAQNLRNEITTTSSTIKIEGDTTTAKNTVTAFRKNVENTTSTAPVNANTANANTKYKAWKDDVGKGTTAPVTAELKNAQTVKSNLEGSLKNVSINGSLTNQTTIKDNFTKSMSSIPIYGKDGQITNQYSIWKNLNEYMSDIKIKGTLNSYELKAQAKEAMSGITIKAVGAGDLNKITGNLYFQAYAQGGFPDTGSLFLANEAGPELVGQIGSRTAVANTQQIIEGIAMGVSNAMQSQNALLSQQNELLSQIARKDSTISVSSVLGAVNKASRRTGSGVIA